MPSKKPSLFGTPFTEPPKQKKPTLLQYLKETKDVKFPFVSRIELIWLPGTWANYTLETPEFRCAITDRNPLFDILEGPAWGSILTSESAILLHVLDDTGAIELLESNLYGVYKPIGSFGLKFHPTEGAN